MQAVELTGRDALIATLQAKLSIARLRAQYGATRKIREDQSEMVTEYKQALRDLGVQS